MPARRGQGQRYTLDAALENLPDRFMDAEVVAVDGDMVGLRKYMADLTDHLEAQTGRRDQTVAAMQTLGIPPSEWYRALLVAKVP